MEGEMMSIILKGIDLPTDRKPYGIEVIYRFEGADGLFSEKNYLSPNQAVQIPKGHGDIKDMDTVNTWGWERPCEQSLENAPTILDKERE